MENSNIAWCDNTFNPWRGCVEESPACDNCYAREMSKRNPAVLGTWGNDGDGGTRIVASETQWRLPVAWNRNAAATGTRARVFCASIADVFEDWRGPMLTAAGLPYWWCGGSMSNSPIPAHQTGGMFDRLVTMDDIRGRLWDLIRETPNLDWLLLTKRSDRIKTCLPPDWSIERYPNVWLGVTAENQEWAEKRIPHLMRLEAAVRFVSFEPLLGEIDLRRLKFADTSGWWNALTGELTTRINFNDGSTGFAETEQPIARPLDWAIIGGESGHKARRMPLDTVRRLMGQLQPYGIATFVKQLGARATDAENGIAGHTLDVPHEARPLISLRLADRAGADPAEWPARYRVQELPTPHREKFRIAPQPA